ncbi:hypothetical protein RIVM261_065180 [Rivularia sp. IAM M-261]|nr:hypothetical protein CAL7716_051820 [Calothrix sp. PCC 7716]GJD21562.1 hypothetical protein RIVM261_065180 [Rivularia sp. IAM M-261]
MPLSQVELKFIFTRLLTLDVVKMRTSIHDTEIDSKIKALGAVLSMLHLPFVWAQQI